MTTYRVPAKKPYAVPSMKLLAEGRWEEGERHVYYTQEVWDNERYRWDPAIWDLFLEARFRVKGGNLWQRWKHFVKDRRFTKHHLGQIHIGTSFVINSRRWRVNYEKRISSTVDHPGNTCPLVP